MKMTKIQSARTLKFTYGLALVAAMVFIYLKFIPVLDDLGVIFLLALMLASVFMREGKFAVRRTSVDLLLFAILAEFALSAFLNDVPLKQALLSFKGYFMIFFVYFFIAYSRFMTPERMRWTIKALFGIYVVQFAIQALQLVAGAATGTLTHDTATGTLYPYGANELSYSYFFLAFYTAHLYIEQKKKEHLKYAVFFMVGMIMSFGQFALLMFPALLFLYHMKTFLKARALFKWVAVASVFVIIYAALALVVPDSTVGEFGLFYLFSPEKLYLKFTAEELDVAHGSARLLWFPVTIERLSQYAYHPLVGMGPGMYASYVGFDLMTGPTRSIYNIFFQEEMSVDASVDSQIIPIWGELGYIGIALFFILFAYLAYRYYKSYSRARTPELRAFSITASASSVYMLFGMYVNHVVESQVLMLLYLLFAGFTERYMRIERMGLKGPVGGAPRVRPE